MNKNYNYIKVKQPAGEMYLIKMNAKDVISISESHERMAYNNDKGIQRRLDQKRVYDIASFCHSKDAMFPTPIILSASSQSITVDGDKGFLNINILENEKYCSIVDGQHRLAGIRNSGKADEFELTVLFIFDTDPSMDAYIFSIINGNQKPVSKSLIYDLYGLSKARTVEKLCNKVMRSLNSNENSKLNGKIKILGYKDDQSSEATVSQSAMIDSLKPLITNDSKRDNLDMEKGRPLKNLNDGGYIFRGYFVHNEDEEIIKHHLNYFNAWIDALHYNKDQYGLSEFKLFEKSIGFRASYKILQYIWMNYPETIGDYEELLSNMFREFFRRGLHEKNYGSSYQGAKQLYEDLKNILEF